MKTLIALLTILVAMILVVPAFAGQEPYKAAVCEDKIAPMAFYLSPKMLQFVLGDTSYYDNSQFIVCPQDHILFPDCIPYGSCFLCTSLCKETFKSKTGSFQPELCDVLPQEVVATTSLTSKGNAGWYEWVIALPKKPEGELNIEIECAVLKPNETNVEECAAETGEIVDYNCTRSPGSYLKVGALPMITAKAYPGGQNEFDPFYLTAYKNPSNYAITRQRGGGQFPGALQNSKSLQILDGSTNARIALKACFEKTILVKWPVDGEQNKLGQFEANLEAGDLIYVRMDIPKYNTVDIYCGQYSVTIGGIGEPLTFTPDSEMPQRYDCGF
jgi:hypothetical protein